MEAPNFNHCMIYSQHCFNEIWSWISSMAKEVGNDGEKRSPGH